MNISGLQPTSLIELYLLKKAKFCLCPPERDPVRLGLVTVWTVGAVNDFAWHPVKKFKIKWLIIHFIKSKREIYSLNKYIEKRVRGFPTSIVQISNLSQFPKSFIERVLKIIWRAAFDHFLQQVFRSTQTQRMRSERDVFNIPRLIVVSSPSSFITLLM